MTKHQRKVGRRLTGMGYAYQGQTAGKNHAVYRHPEGGRITVSGTPSDHRDEANIIAEARRRVRTAHTNGQEFADYLCRHHHVPRDGEIEIPVTMTAAVEEWIASGAADGQTRLDRHNFTPVVTSARTAGRIDPVVRGRGKHLQSVWKVRGRDWNEDVQDEAITPDVPGEGETVFAGHPLASESDVAPAARRGENGHAEHAEQLAGVNLQPITSLREAIPELERWISAGVLADLKDRDERIAVGLASITRAVETAHAIAREADTLAAQLDEARAILDGSTTPNPPTPAPEVAQPVALTSGAG